VHVEPLGDQAVLVRLPDEDETLRFAAALRSAEIPGITDVVQSFHTVAAFFDSLATDYPVVRDRVAAIRPSADPPDVRRHEIPCCYEDGPDLRAVAETLGLTTERLIELHSGRDFTVHAIGFSPGFPYLGKLPEELRGLPRLAQPRVRVERGAVGIVDEWSCIYTLPTPGGWNLIGRTPLVIADADDDFFPIRAGDRIRFRRIGRDEFRRLEGKKLTRPLKSDN